MEKDLQRKLKSMVQGEKDIKKIISVLNEYDTEIQLEVGTPLNHAINYNKNELVKYLIERGANVNALYEDNYSPLMSAVDGNNLEMAKLLLKNGADINLIDEHGNNALWKALPDNVKIARLLLEHKADPYQTNKVGKNSVDRLNLRGSDEMKALFMEFNIK